MARLIQQNFVGTDTTGVSEPFSSRGEPRVFGVTARACGAHVDFSIAVDKPCAVALSVFDVRGKMLWSHAMDQARAGICRVVWAAAGSTDGGVYFVKLRRAGEQIAGETIARFSRQPN